MATPDPLTQIATDVAWLKEHAKEAENSNKEFFKRLATIEAEVKHLRDIAPTVHLTELNLARFRAGEQGEDAQRAKTGALWGIVIATLAFAVSVSNMIFGGKP